MGAPYNDDNGGASGQVRVYRYNALRNEYEQMGLDCNGAVEGISYFGSSVSISADGRTFAVGAPNIFGKGYVRVYKYMESDDRYEPFGLDIVGEGEEDLFGSSVTLSADGSTMVVGARRNDGNGSDSGHVRSCVPASSIQ